MSKDKFKLILAGFIIGFITGIALALLIVKFAGGMDNGSSSKLSDSETERNEAIAASPAEASASPAAGDTETSNLSDYPEWDSQSVYTNGDTVLYQNKIYRAKWWTQNELPGNADVWEDTKETPAASSETPAASGAITVKDNPALKNAQQSDSDLAGFKITGYYPSWEPAKTDKIRYDVLTHIIYAFAIPTKDGTLRPLDNPETAREIIRTAHENKVKVLIAVGGWSYHDIPLESTFNYATETEEKRASLVNDIIKLCDDYGFDGVDMDWEHPRVDGASAKQYEALMLSLSESLHANGKVLTAAVLSGATADGNIYYDAAAHSDKVLAATDWIHVMAYDGGDAERHSSYEFATASAGYWKDTRKLPPEKVVLGVPFYGRPGWNTYDQIITAAPDAWQKDTALINGITSWYNGASTIEKKTQYALNHLGGIMVWEITQDTSNPDKSLLSVIGNTVHKKMD